MIVVVFGNEWNVAKIQPLAHLEGNMCFRMAADFVVVLHAVFVLFASLGGVIVLKWPRAAWLHVPCFLWAAWVELAGWLCPLTPLENLLRAKAGAITYQTGFIAHYLMPVLYPEGLTRTIQVCLGLVVLIGNVILYAILINSNRSGWWRHSRRPSI